LEKFVEIDQPAAGQLFAVVNQVGQGVVFAAGQVEVAAGGPHGEGKAATLDGLQALQLRLDDKRIEHGQVGGAGQRLRRERGLPAGENLHAVDPQRLAAGRGDGELVGSRRHGGDAEFAVAVRDAAELGTRNTDTGARLRPALRREQPPAQGAGSGRRPGDHVFALAGAPADEIRTLQQPRQHHLGFKEAGHGRGRLVAQGVERKQHLHLGLLREKQQRVRDRLGGEVNFDRSGPDGRRQAGDQGEEQRQTGARGPGKTGQAQGGRQA
jgi:hypothetical protein